MKASLPLGQRGLGQRSQTGWRVALCGALLLSLSACSEGETEGPDFKDEPLPEGARLVYTVDGVDVALLKSTPMQIQITASGSTRTGGWSEPQLVLDEDASEGTRLVYRFVAVPPSGAATQAITPITASVTYGPWIDRAARQIEVVAETSSETMEFPGQE